MPELTAFFYFELILFPKILVQEIRVSRSHLDLAV